jgi:hypothetical protein
MPFLHPDVIAVTQRVSLATTKDGTFYRRILDAAMGDGAGDMRPRTMTASTTAARGSPDGSVTRPRWPR